MHSAASLNLHLNSFPFLQQYIPLCFSTSYKFHVPAVLNRVNEANGHRMGNSSGRGKELQGTLRSSARFMTPPRSEEREVQVQMEEAKKVDFRSKLSAEQRKGRQQEEPKAKTKTNEKDEFCTSQIDAFDTGLPQAVTERRRRDRGREEGGDENDDEQQQTFYSFDSALSSAQLHTQNITAPSTFATHLFSPFLHTQLSAPSVLVGTPPKPSTSSSPATDSFSLTQKSFDMTSPSSASLSNMSSSSSPSASISSFSLPPLVTVQIPYAILGKSRLGNAGVFASSSVSATRDVFEPQSILLNNAAYVASQGVRVGGEKEGKEGKGEKKDEKRSANEFVSDKDERGSLCLTDKCIDNEKNEGEEEEEEYGFDKDIRKAQKK
ncbi:uncharacterized protein MONOS_12253 [Monocercomonoides exilis]|uniref:uncharacterized protein n=1 Tax=Monocercomonoides exilis TaxID=2049356 RepID=UPI003559613E|nr:hypothetical protein MONOS_12253 [Monocercomonoides exilis]|eukprot:MONOS_12253.1-p1 / transcript=MONOS_12253.1 / gene=MONOS_12253 / organism=Monocercomonoides_exilis_PA203 / gene_product=unspecified product / transcript_product=unspecified product / location=Mono_scaffold00665:25981-27117(+) / protein_length=379 / sequence_SO=supercontig / SO=protein_coding / is_pseudo=false